MDHYFDIRAIPNPEIRQSAVMAHLMQQLHRLLPQYRRRIGLDFPGYRKKQGLGAVIRVFGIAQDIQAIRQQVANANDITEYSLITSTEEIPNTVEQFARYTRVHAKGNSYFNRLKRRHQTRGTWTAELELQIRSKANLRLSFPHINLRSDSTGQNFILFINRTRVAKPVAGLFNGYGLSGSDISTVPVFV